MRPDEGGCAVDMEGGQGYAVVTESVRAVMHRINSARADFALDLNDEKLWVELTVIADPDEETDRRPCWLRADKIICLTYCSTEMIHKLENEIS